MILSNITPRATIRGTIFRGGGGGVTSYDQLNDKPQINDITIEGNHDGNYYGLANLDDVPIIGVNLTPSALIRITTLTINGTAYQVAYSNFEEGSNGLVPAPTAADAGKVLYGDGTWKTPYKLPDYSTTEQNTGQKWIDGKDIYVKVIDLGSVQTLNAGWHDIEPHLNYYDTLLDAYCTGGNYQMAAGTAVNGPTYLEVYFPTTSSIRYIVFKYTKA